jgi:carbon monoxide dehydrogenase subunit G
MDMSGEYVIAAPRETVWAALNDAEVLKACIPGCDELVKTSDTTMEAKVTQKIGPVKAKFAGAVELVNIDAPNGYTIRGEGKGGVAGFAKGSADVSLSEEEEGTRLVYSAKADVGGKLAQLGGRLINSTAKRLADQFFENFHNHLTNRETAGGT